MSTATELWAANADLAQLALQHRFVRGLADGSLPPGTFKAYIQQDAFFLQAFVRAYALALARCQDSQGLHDFFELLGGALDELRLHASYAARWGVDVRDVRPAPATLSYTDFVLATAALGGVGETCAAMAPCMRLYAYLGQSLAGAGAATARNPYAEWVRTYAAPEFQTLADKLEALVDRYAVDGEGVRSVYRRAMSLEVAFFEAACSSGV
ncbi:MAG: TenA family protein [Chloroflexota bacterium]|nr:TenA family protein [Chloroflexota bacterium]